MGVAARAVPVEHLRAPGAVGVAVLRRVERAAVDLRAGKGPGLLPEKGKKSWVGNGA